MPIQTLSDLKKNVPKGNPGGGPPGGPPGGGFFGGFGGGESPSSDSKNVRHLRGDDSALVSELKKAGSKLVVVDFTATWCGPCKRIAPVFSQMADEFPQVVFIKVDVDESKDIAQSRGVRSMPTFQLYKNNSKIVEWSGADPNRLRAEVEKHKTSDSSSSSSSSSSMSGGSYVLGGNSTNPNPPRPASERPPAPQFDDDEDDDDLLRKFGKKSGSGGAKAEVNPVLLSNLKDMGFSTSQAKKALESTGGKNVEAAMDWCFSHPQDPEEAEKEKAAEAEAAKNAPEKSEEVTPMEGVEGVVSDSQPQKPQLTEEEKKAKLDELLRRRREEKAKEEEDKAKERELTRRAGGKDVIEAKRKWEEGQREREELARKKEKDDDARAKANIKAKLEQDKREREAAAAARSGAAPPSVPTPAPVAAAPVAKKEYTEAFVQIRFQDGSNVKAGFKPTDTLQTVHDHVAVLLGKTDFGLLSNFPKKLYTPADPSSMSVTLQEAQFVPSGTLMVTGK